MTTVNATPLLPDKDEEKATAAAALGFFQLNQRLLAGVSVAKLLAAIDGR